MLLFAAVAFLVGLVEGSSLVWDALERPQYWFTVAAYVTRMILCTVGIVLGGFWTVPPEDGRSAHAASETVSLDS